MYQVTLNDPWEIFKGATETEKIRDFLFSILILGQRRQLVDIFFFLLFRGNARSDFNVKIYRKMQQMQDGCRIEFKEIILKIDLKIIWEIKLKADFLVLIGSDLIFGWSVVPNLTQNIFWGSCLQNVQI